MAKPRTRPQKSNPLETNNNQATTSTSATINQTKPDDINAAGDDDDILNSTLDHSILREPINLGKKSVLEIINCISDGSKEVKDLILNECSMIYECRRCRSLFRSLVNFLTHKRIYCKKHCCIDMVLYDPRWYDNNINERADILENQDVPKPSTSKSNIPITAESIVESANKRPANSMIDHEQRMFKKKRIETLLCGLKKATTPETKKSWPNNNGEQPKQQSIGITGRLTRNSIKAKPGGTGFLSKKREDQNHLNDSNHMTRPIDFVCINCEIRCSYISSSVRHLINFHHLSRQKAKEVIFKRISKNSDDTIEYDGKCTIKRNDKRENESKITSFSEIDDESRSQEPIVENKKSETTAIEGLPLDKGQEQQQKDSEVLPKENNSSNETENCSKEKISGQDSSPEVKKSSSDGGTSSKRYETRCLSRNKSVYNCNSESCVYFKHCICPKIESSTMTTTTNNMENRQTIENNSIKSDGSTKILEKVSGGDKTKDNAETEIIVIDDDEPMISGTKSTPKSVSISVKKSLTQQPGSSGNLQQSLVIKKYTSATINTFRNLLPKLNSLAKTVENNENSESDHHQHQNNQKSKLNVGIIETRSSISTIPKLPTPSTKIALVTNNGSLPASGSGTIVTSSHYCPTKNTIISEKINKTNTTNGASSDSQPEIIFIDDEPEPSHSLSAISNTELPVATSSSSSVTTTVVLATDNDDTTGNENELQPGSKPMVAVVPVSDTFKTSQLITKLSVKNNQQDLSGKDSTSGLKIHLRPTARGSNKCYQIVNTGTDL